LKDLDANDLSPPFGAFEPTPMQRRVVHFVRATPLNRGVFRDRVVRLLQWFRPGPIDWQVGGAAFRLHLAGNGTDIGLLLKPDFDRAEIAFLAEAARGSVFVDVGANVGAYALLVAAAAERKCRVVAVEPLPAVAAQLRANIAATGLQNVAVLEHAVGETEGHVSLAVNEANLGASSVGRGGTTVRLRPLLDALREADVDAIGAMKIDVEGYEDRVLVPFMQSAPRTMWPCRIVIEHLQRSDWQTDCISMLSQHGYAAVGMTRSNTLFELRKAA
jgi:FkbM family methyltransferase